MSRMTFTIDAKEDEVRQLVKVMEKQVDVVNAKILDHKKTIKKEKVTKIILPIINKASFGFTLKIYVCPILHYVQKTCFTRLEGF